MLIVYMINNGGIMIVMTILTRTATITSNI